MKQKIVLLIAAVIGMIAFFTTHVYIKGEREKIYAGARTVRVVAANEDLPAGTVLTGSDLTTIDVFESSMQRGTITADRAKMVIGKTLVYSLAKNNAVTWLHIGVDRDNLTKLSNIVPDGMRAIAIPVSSETAVAGLVQPNDLVDVLGTFTFDTDNPGEYETVTFTVLQNVTVLATGTQTANTAIQTSARRRNSYNTVSIAVTPAEAELLAFSMHVKGTLALSLRNPKDIKVEPSHPPINFQKLREELPRLNQKRLDDSERKTINGRRF